MSFTVFFIFKELSKVFHAPLTRGSSAHSEITSLYRSSCSVAEHHIGPVHHVILMLVESLTVVIAAGPLYSCCAINLCNLSAGQSSSNFQLLICLRPFKEVLVRSIQEALVILEVGWSLLRIAMVSVTLHHLVFHCGGHTDRVNPVGVVKETVATGIGLDILPAITLPSAGHKVHGAFIVLFFSELVLFGLELGQAFLGLH